MDLKKRNKSSYNCKDQIDNLYLPKKCLLIDKTDMNKDLFNKIMIYKYYNKQQI